MRGRAVAVMAVDDNAPSDLFVEYLRTRALHEPGLFRVHRPVKLIRQLWQRFSTCGPREKQWALLAEEKDPHLVAGLLLWRLRELEPLLPFARYADVVATGERDTRPAVFIMKRGTSP